MREGVLDTETTGLEFDQGHRMVEIGMVELEDHRPTGRTFHAYFNPERDMPPEALKVHGLTSEFLSKQPVFMLRAADIYEFIGDAKLVAHNASFDRAFLNLELTKVGLPAIAEDRMIDTLLIAGLKHGGNNTLDGLCKRYKIDTAKRDKHGALVDAELLAKVYLELIEEKQARLDFSFDRDRYEAEAVALVLRLKPLSSPLTPEDIALHRAFIAEQLKGEVIWNDYLTERKQAA
jgi:DNA polymerase III subunit epsilon